MVWFIAIVMVVIGVVAIWWYRRIGVNPVWIEKLDELDGDEFERLVERLLRFSGFRVLNLQASRDQGADLLASKGDRIIVIQCKRYSKPVGSPVIRETVGAKEYYGANEAWVVTTSRFTLDAKKAAFRTGVRLVDRNGLVCWIENYRQRQAIDKVLSWLLGG